MRSLFAIAGLLVLCGCNKAPSGDLDGPLRTDEPTANVQSNEAEQVVPQQVGELPEQGRVPRFVGNWAKTQQACQTAAWKFTVSTLRMPTGESCSFNRVTEVPGGYDIQTTCSAKGPPMSDELKLRFAESAKAMLMESKALEDGSLIYCGRDV